MSTSARFDFAPLLPAGLPAPAARWTGLAKYSFVGGNNDPEQVPVDGLLEAFNAVMKREGKNLATYNLAGGPQGYVRLREFLTQKLKRDAGIVCTPDDLMIVSGSLQALDLVNATLLTRGDTVLVEQETYQGSLNRLTRLGVNTVGIPLDGEGMRMDALASALADHKRRGVFVIKAEHSLKGIVRYLNRDTISDYQLAVFEEGGEFLTPFFVKCPKVTPINIGDVVKVPPLDGANNLARDAFYSATLPAGDYKLSAEFRRVDGKNSLMGGRVSVLSSDGHELQHPVSVTENAVSEKGFAKLSLAEDQPLIFQVRTAHTLETAVLKVEPWIEE